MFAALKIRPQWCIHYIFFASPNSLLCNQHFIVDFSKAKPPCILYFSTRTVCYLMKMYLKNSWLWWKETINCCFEISMKTVRTAFTPPWLCMQQCRQACITIRATSANNHFCFRGASLPVIHSHFTGELGKCCSHREQPVRQPTDGALVGLWADLAWTQAKSFLKFILKLIVTLKTVILRVGVQGYPES